MPIIRTTFCLLLLSLSFTSKAQYNEAMCILLKQQMHEYRFNTSNKNYRSAARNYEKNCKNPTPVNNAAGFEKLEQQTKEIVPVNSATAANPNVHSGAILATPEEETTPAVEQPSEINEQQTQPEQLAAEPQVQEPVSQQQQIEQSSTPAEQTEMPAKVDRITISDAPEEPVVESTTSPAIQEQAVAVKPQSAEAEVAPAEKPVEPETKVDSALTPIPAPTPAPIPENNDSSSSSLFMPSLIVLLVLLVAGLVIVRIRQSKKADEDSELEQSLMQAKALKAAAEAQAAAEKEAEELKNATAAVLSEEQDHPHADSNIVPDNAFSAIETQSSDELSELMHFSAQHDTDEQESKTSAEPAPADDFANAHQFKDLELGYDEKNTHDSEDDFLDEQRELEQELKLANLSSSFTVNEEVDTQSDDVQQDEPALGEQSFTSSSFGFDEYSTKEPIAEDEPRITETQPFEEPELEAPEITELEKPEIEEPSFTASSSFGFNEYSTKEPIADDEPVLAEIEELEKPEIDELEKPVIEEPSFTASSSFGFDEYSAKEPIADDEPAKDEVPEYDLSSLMDDDLSFTDHFTEQDQTVTAPNTTADQDDISDDDLAKALQALEQELQDEPASFSLEEPTQPIEETVDVSKELNDDDELKEADKELEQQDDKPYNPFANLSLDPAWDPSSDEKPVIESKSKQPKSQALIDAEERAKQFKTDE